MTDDLCIAYDAGCFQEPGIAFSCPMHVHDSYNIVVNVNRVRVALTLIESSFVGHGTCLKSNGIEKLY